MKLNVRLQLSTMMFLNFFIWGIWFVTMGNYLPNGILHASGEQNALAYGTQSIGAFIAPFIVGMIADRFFSAQKILGFLHLAGAALMYGLYMQTDFNTFYLLLFIYMILYMPTLALVNAIALKQINNPEKEFSLIRIWGTIGWIVAGLLITALAWEPPVKLVEAASSATATVQDKDALTTAASLLRYTFLAAAVASAVLGLFSFTLPHTPPPKAGQRVTVSDVLGLDALKLLLNKNYLIFFIASMLICIPLAFYYQNANTFLSEAGMPGATGKMAMGQASEAIFLFLMPAFFARFNVKKMLLFGMIAWALRYLLFGFGDSGAGIWMLYGGIILHGICYDFFFVTGQIYTDKVAGPRIRSSAQGMITLATYGIGMFFGFLLAGKITDHYATGEHSHNWQMIWMVPAIIAAVIAIVFLLLFTDKSTARKSEIA